MKTSSHWLSIPGSSLLTAIILTIGLSLSAQTVTDIDGNVYNTVTIGTQTWMVENLKTTRYRNGDLIGTTVPATLDISGEMNPKYQWAYNGNETYVPQLGRLYTWYAATDSRNICPTGWHLPSDAEWTVLTEYLGGDSIAGGKLKESGTLNWLTPNEGATNETGFSALPGGLRGISGVFQYGSGYGGWWSSTEYPPSSAWFRYVVYNNKTVTRDNYCLQYNGFSVRCIKDSADPDLFSGGSGTQADPYLVATPANLNNVRGFLGVENSDVYFLQTTDIDLGVAPWNEGEGWTPIGSGSTPFCGKYNGNGFSITGLTINRPATNLIGLFGVTSGASLTNVGLLNVDITGYLGVGALAGLAQYNTYIGNCYSRGIVKGEVVIGGLLGRLYYSSTLENSFSSVNVQMIPGVNNQQAAGLVGRVRFNSTINNCFATGKVEGLNAWAGGLVAILSEGEINNCYTTGEVYGDSYVGGLIGLQELGNLTNSYSVGKVSFTTQGGGLIGNSTGGGVSINSYWNNETSGQSVSAAGEPKNTSEMIYTATFASWDFSSIWSVDEGLSYPYLQWQGNVLPFNTPPAFIPPSNLTALIVSGSISLTWQAPSMGTVTGYNIYRDSLFFNTTGLTNFTDASATNYKTYSYYVSALYNMDESAHSNRVSLFTHLGFGSGDGSEANPYIISNAGELYTVRAYLASNFRQNANIDLGVAPWNTGGGWEPIGSLGNQFTGTYNGDGFTISNLTINRPFESAVGLFGSTNGALIENVNLENANVIGNQYVGCLAGDINFSKLENIFTSGTASGNTYSGGIVGGSWNYSNINKSHSSGFASSSVSWAGGIAGVNYSNCLINNCYSTVNVSATGESVGGISGTNEINSTISNSYSLGNVSGDKHVGGITGWLSNSMINSCFSTGSVTGNITTGGLAGTLVNNGLVTKSYWNTQTSGQTTSAGGEGRTTDEMTYVYATNTYSDWDFTYIWAKDIASSVNNGYPYLRLLDVNMPTISTTTAEDITHNSADITANVSSDGGIPVTQRGICWGLEPNPTVFNSHIYIGSGIGTFTGNLTGLNPETDYYARAYAINSLGIAYGESIGFTTKLGYYSNATLNGPWFFHIEPLTPYNDSLSYLVFDGNGNIIDMSGFGSPIGGTYSVSSSGIFTGNLIMDEDTYPLNGQLTSPDGGTCEAAGMNWIISRITNPGALADTLIGTLHTEYCGQRDVTIILNSHGEVISAIGLVPPVSGRIYADQGVFLGHLKTGDNINNGWNEFSITGYYTDKLLNGMVSLDAQQGSCGNTVSQLVRKGTTTEINFGFEDWTTVGNYENPDEWATMNPNCTGPFYSCTKSTDHYPISEGNYSIRLENNTSLTQYTGGYGTAITNAFDYPFKPAFSLSGHPNSLTGYYKYNSLNNDSMFIRIILFQNGVIVGDNKFVSGITASTWTSFTIPLTYTSADSATIWLSAFSPSGPTAGPKGNSVLFVDNLNFDYLITEKFNFGFELWNDMGSYMDPQCFETTNSFSPGTFYPVTRSEDHYPVSVGNYSIRIESKVSLLPGVEGLGLVLQNSKNSMEISGEDSGPGPSFPIIGHPTSLTGYYKYAPQNGDTMRIQIQLFQNGSDVSYNVFLSSVPASSWTSFTIPLPPYTTADSGSILLASYNANGPPPEFSPYGNSVLYVDNLNFDNLITGENCQSDFDFVINSTNGITSFTSKTLNASSYYWDFGDGAFSTQINPSHTYTKAGAYNVCLTIMNSTNNCQSVICKNLIYTPAGEKYITADFSFTTNSTNNSVIFNDLSSSNTTDWYWTMGDGKVMNTRNPVYTYSNPGVYSVCLTAIDKVNLLMNTVCKQVKVGETACNIAAEFSYFINPEEQSVAFSNKSVGTVTNYFWTFGDGGSSSLENPSHTYSSPGFYLISLSVRNSSNNCMDMTAQFIQVGGVDCRAGFTFGVDPVTNTVSFMDDSKGDIDYYYWDFGDGSFSTLENPAKLYKKAGIFLVGQTVIDNANACIDVFYQPVQAGEIDCAAEFVSYVDALTSTAYFTNKVVGESTALLWSFGDGRFSTNDNPVHIFPSAGIYSVGLNTFDFNSGCMDYYQEKLLIGGLGIDCEADFTYLVDPSDPDVTFSNKSVGDIVSSLWNFGDGSENSADPDPVHAFTKGGYYYVCLNVTNSSGIRNMTCKWVLVEGSATNDCRANFMFSIDSTSRKVTFVDNSFGEPDKYTWDFGDSRTDSVSKVKDPIHTYDTKGYYLVQLKIENSASGCVSSEYKLMNVAELQVLKAAFGYEARDPDKKVSGYPVDLVSASSGDGATVEWDFGDKQIKKETLSFTVMDSTSGIVTHYYEKPGKYRVCLRISDKVSGQTDEYCQYVFTKFGVGVNEIHGNEMNLAVYPNPFNDYTTISYSLPENQFVEMAVFDQMGRRMETLLKTRKDAGEYQIGWDTKGIAPGIYHLKLITEEGIFTRQLVVAR